MYQLQMLTQVQINNLNNLNRFLSPSKIEGVFKAFSTKKTQSQTFSINTSPRLSNNR